MKAKLTGMCSGLSDELSKCITNAACGRIPSLFVTIAVQSKYA